jgi:hypothetical protein
MLQEKVAHIPNCFAQGINISSNMKSHKQVTRERGLERPRIETHIGVEFQIMIGVNIALFYGI